MLWMLNVGTLARPLTALLGGSMQSALRFQPDSRLEQVWFIVGNFSAHVPAAE